MSVSTNASLIDILDRILDKGLVIAGDVRVSLANVELLTIRIRLLVCSVDKAEQIGLNWWKHDPSLTAVAGPSLLSASPPAARRRVHAARANGRAVKASNGRRRTLSSQKKGG